MSIAKGFGLLLQQTLLAPIVDYELDARRNNEDMAESVLLRCRPELAPDLPVISTHAAALEENMNPISQRLVSFADLPYVPASHEDSAQPAVLKKVLFRREDFQAGSLQMLNWAKLAAGKAFSAHYHEDMQEVFLIVEGEASLDIDGQTVHLARGDAISIQPGEVHRMWNDGERDVEYIVFGITNGSGGQTAKVADS